ncbi:hypothetical protein LVB87_11090 [Lysobacter sp. KIS68-7]|uniref:glycerophosphodiester phosphodiesterase n=1 Tax=Lysobacter sp. KIS68-7 TaxID=2904252 RepID=UPI001E629F47|nr:glycerophosphodiester phosphodiesterase family protein [Lysobacter sp. KIS68-7]UHQ18731.1 hypothetical protein LVB87_11090 [Lysobacter sp. KIS68-7]
MSEPTPVADVPSLDAIGPGDFVCIAHRGAAALAPENTMVAYRAAYASGLRLLEQDARLLADGALAVMHDASVDRLTDGRGDVRGFDTAAYRALRVDARRFPQFAQQTIAPALFDEVLAEFRGRAVLVPEAKDVGSGAPMVAALQRAGIAREHALVQSFLLEELRPAVDAGYPAIYLSRTDEGIDAVKAAGVGWAGIWKGASDTVFRAWIEAGFRVIAYTVDDHAERDRLRGLGVQGMFSDDPFALMAGLPSDLRCVY